MKTQKAMLGVGLFFLRLAIVIFVIIGIYRVGEYSYLFCYSIVSDVAVEAEPGRDVSVTLDGDERPKEVAQLLEKKGLVKDARIFQMQLKINKYEDTLQSGTYILNTSMTPRKMMKVMSGEIQGEGEE